MIKISLTGTVKEINLFKAVLQETGVLEIVRSTELLEHHGSKKFSRIYLDIRVKNSDPIVRERVDLFEKMLMYKEDSEAYLEELTEQDKEIEKLKSLIEK